MNYNYYWHIQLSIGINRGTQMETGITLILTYILYYIHL